MLPQRACPTWKKIRERYRRRRPWKKNSRALPQGGLPALETKFASVSAGEPAPLKTQSLGGPPPCKKNRERYRSGPAPLGKNSASAIAGGPAPRWKKFRERYRREACPRWKKIRERAERPAPRWKKFRERYRKGPAPLGKKIRERYPIWKKFGEPALLGKIREVDRKGACPPCKKIASGTAGGLSAFLEKIRERYRRGGAPLEKKSRALLPQGEGAWPPWKNSRALRQGLRMLPNVAKMIFLWCFLAMCPDSG